MSKIKKERETWIDYAKVIGIILVLLGHIKLIDPTLQWFIFSFHMPLFFFISGYLHKSADSIGSSIKKDVQRLLLPYVYFYLITYALWLAAFLVNHKNDTEVIQEGVIKPLLGLLVGVGYETDISLSVNHPIWFLVGLFVAKSMFTVIEKITGGNKLYITLIIIVLTVAVTSIKLAGYDLWFSIDSAVLALPFLYAGVLTRSFGTIKKWFGNNSVNLIWVVLMGTITFFLCIYNQRVDINSTNWGNNLLVYYLEGFTGMLMVFALCFVLDQYPTKFILFVSANTMVLLATQSKLKSVVVSGFRSVGYRFPEKVDITQALVITLAIFILSLPVMYIIDKYFPFLAGGTKKIKLNLQQREKSEL